MGFASRKGAFREGSLDQYLKEISQYPLIDKAEAGPLQSPLRGLGGEKIPEPGRAAVRPHQ